MKYFNTDGPCNETKHYTIDVSMRLKDAERLMDAGQYLVIHAAPQCGKTTYLRDRANRFNAGGRYYAVYCPLKDIGKATEPREAVPEIIKIMKNDLEISNNPFESDFAARPDYDNFAGVLNIELTLFCMKLKKPLIILFDDADLLSDDSLIALLRQIRDGYNNRFVVPFVHSVVLSGVRNIRDYKSRLRPYRESLGINSPFNIFAETLRMNNFLREELVNLYGQHTKETGQQFEVSAINHVYKWTRGQPWMVNAIVNEVIEKTLKRDYSVTITVEHVEEAVQTILSRRDTHISGMFERLKEDRLRRVVEPMITGGKSKVSKFSDDYLYALDLGLIHHEWGKAEPYSPVYAEMMARSLAPSRKGTNGKVQQH